MFKVIDGGLMENSRDSRKKFISAYITNTRLMGVVGIFAHWKLIDNEMNTEFYQCFYLDAEEYGFDSYEYVAGPDTPETEEKAEKLADRLMGGLGGVRVEISERETRSLVQDYVYLTLRQGLEIPEEADIEFIMKPGVRLNVTESRELMKKQCEELYSEYQLVNYFIMRCVGSDLEAARYLTKGYVRLKEFTDRKPATLHRNESELIGQDMSEGSAEGSFSTSRNYRCQSLIEGEDGYEVMISRVTVENMKVTKFEMISLDQVSSIEANMMTRREEYTLLGELYLDPEDFTKESTSYTRVSQETRYDTGRMFMIFNRTNAHVAERVYRIFDDVFGLYFITDSGQLLISSFDSGNLKALERDALIYLGRDNLEFVARYCFDVPVLYEFVKSGFDDFEYFVEAISTQDPE